MTSKPTTTLDTAIAAAKKLPQEMQDAIAHDVMEQVSGYQHSQMTDQQRADLKRRLSKPLILAPRKAVVDAFKRFKIV